MKTNKRRWGYEVIMETNSDFREQFIKNCFEQCLKVIKIYNEKGKKNTKISFRLLQPDEIPNL